MNTRSIQATAMLAAVTLICVKGGDTQPKNEAAKATVIHAVTVVDRRSG